MSPQALHRVPDAVRAGEPLEITVASGAAEEIEMRPHGLGERGAHLLRQLLEGLGIRQPLEQLLRNLDDALDALRT